MTLNEGFDNNKTRLKNYDFTVPQTIQTTTSDFIPETHSKQHPTVSSIPKHIDQTQEDLIEPDTPNENKKIKNGKELYKPAQNNDELDLF